MSKLLVVGQGPLFSKGVRNFGGQCLRTWCFAEPLMQAGHDVRLVTLPIFDPYNPEMQQAGLDWKEGEGFRYQAFRNLNFGFIHEELSKIVQDFDPDALFGINSTPALTVVRLPGRKPLWADLFGYSLAENQGAAAREMDGKKLLAPWRQETRIVRRADRFSVVSEPQKYALLGEAAGVGRINAFTFEYSFAHTVPVAFHPAFLRSGPAPSRMPRPRPTLRKEGVPDDAFVLLWSGGYNFWTDPVFLFEFLEATMRARPEVHFVSTGGSIAGYNESTYGTFCDLIEQSALRERFHLLGWIDAEKVPPLYDEADLGLSIDEANYETLFGARNRINNMMAAGLPVLTTYGAEISHEVEESGAGVVCMPGEAVELKQAALDLAGKRHTLEALGERARTYARMAFAPAHVVAPALEWAKNPTHAPDNAEKIRRFPLEDFFLKTPLTYTEEIARILEQENMPRLLDASQKLNALRSKSWYRLMRGLRRVFNQS